MPLELSHSISYGTKQECNKEKICTHVQGVAQQARRDSIRIPIIGDQGSMFAMLAIVSKPRHRKKPGDACFRSFGGRLRLLAKSFAC